MKTDVQIAQAAEMKDIREIAASVGIPEEYLELYGHHKAKVSQKFINTLKKKKDGKLILVTAINPTTAGEGKTTVNIGLSMALNRIGKKTFTTLREPSLGPCFGIKGGAAGGGYSQVLPMEDINLHFTGDIHAVTSANNLLAALIDNHMRFGNPLKFDPDRILWRRAIDMNDRSLRHTVVGIGGRVNGFTREDGFDISVASEIMAVLCLAEDFKDLKRRLAKIVIAYSTENKPITVKDLGGVGAVSLLLKDAIEPNLVQTIENTPAFIHGGPFANIAHGCNSVIATKTALKLADYVVTEAGFGADLGAEKFFDIKCRSAKLAPSAVVIVATVRALKKHGGAKELVVEDLPKLVAGFANLNQHIENVKKYGVPIVVAINRFPTDTDEEIKLLQKMTEQAGTEAIVTEVYAKGGEGAVELAEKVVELANQESHFKPLYDLDMPLKEKIEKIAKEIYRAGTIHFDSKAIRALEQFEADGFGDLPICVAKTQYSFTDNQHLLGAPKDFEFTISDCLISAGAGFVIAMAGEIVRMPGLPKHPSAMNIDVRENGEIVGLF